MTNTHIATLSTHSLRRLALVVLVLIASLFVVAAVSADEARAHTGSGSATPYNDSSHPWSHNGCSWVLDAGPSAIGGAYFNFRHACIHHDGCYGGRWASKFTCDLWFKNDMYASCAVLWPWGAQRWSCQRQADLYYTGVGLFGGPAWFARSINIRLA